MYLMSLYVDCLSLKRILSEKTLVIRNAVWWVCLFLPIHDLPLIILTNWQMLSWKCLAQDKQQVSKKKRGQGKSGHFMAGVCKNAYGPFAFKDKSTCRAVKCNACLLIGDGFQDEMVTTEQVELKKVGQRSLPAQPVRIRSKRVSKNKDYSSAEHYFVE